MIYRVDHDVHFEILSVSPEGESNAIKGFERQVDSYTPIVTVLIISFILTMVIDHYIRKIIKSKWSWMAMPFVAALVFIITVLIVTSYVF